MFLWQLNVEIIKLKSINLNIIAEAKIVTCQNNL